MRTSRNLSERDYKRAYKLLRSGVRWDLGGGFRSIDDVILDCAILSYDYYDSHFSGWINRQRMFKFHERTEAIATAGSWPF